MSGSRSNLALWLLLMLALASIAASVPSTLRQSAERAGVLVGTAVRPCLFSEPGYAETLAREYNMVEPEDAMKWFIVRRNQQGFDFREGDEVVAFAQAHGMKVRGHCLVWDHANPGWLMAGHFTPDQMSHLLQEHIATVMKRYAGQVFAWDVVNEAFDERGNVKDSPWYNQPGIGMAGKGSVYVEQAFRWAHDVDPDALLFYNDNGAEGLTRKSDTVYAMVKDFKQRGVPINGVGLQMHLSGLNFDSNAVAGNIARLSALGLQVHITELDIPLPLQADGSVRSDDLSRQAEIYRAVVRTCLQNAKCTAIQTWGFTDKYSWIGSHSHHSRGAALPFDAIYKPKPAYDAIVEEMAQTRR